MHNMFNERLDPLLLFQSKDIGGGGVHHSKHNSFGVSTWTKISTKALPRTILRPTEHNFPRWLCRLCRLRTTTTCIAVSSSPLSKGENKAPISCSFSESLIRLLEHSVLVCGRRGRIRGNALCFALDTLRTPKSEDANPHQPP